MKKPSIFPERTSASRFLAPEPHIFHVVHWNWIGRARIHLGASHKKISACACNQIGDIIEILIDNIDILVDKCPDGAQRLEDHLVNDDPRHGSDARAAGRVRPRRRRARVGPRVAAASVALDRNIKIQLNIGGILGDK